VTVAHIHFSLLCAKLSRYNFYRHNNWALCNNLEHLLWTW